MKTLSPWTPTMTDPTAKAKDLLARVSLKRECDDAIRRQGCKSCDEWWPVVVPARVEMYRLGFRSPEALRVAIGLAEAAEAVECEWAYTCEEYEAKPLGPITDRPCNCCKALTDWAKLLED